MKSWSFGLSILSASLVLGTAVLAAETGQIQFDRGPLELRMADFESILEFEGQQIRLETAYLPEEQARWKNSVLVDLHTGGTMCPGTFAWITIDDNGLSTTGSFGTCSDLMQIEAQDDRQILISMPRLNGSGASGFVFDGKTVQEVELGLKSAGVADPKNAASWAGKSAGEVVASAEMEPILLQMVDWETLEFIRASSVIGGDVMEEDGAWYAATGCMAHQCNAFRAGVAVSKADGSVLLATWSAEAGGKIFGTPGAALPNRLRSLLAGN